MKKISAIIEARMSSTRLPGKIMKIANKKPMILHLVNRLKKVSSLYRIIIATTTNKNDDILCNYLKKKKILFYRGSEEDVLGRVYYTAKKFNVKNILQITGDCPLVDPNLTSQVINIYLNNNFDFVSNANIRTFPVGMDVSVFNFKSLKKAHFQSRQKYYREHSTLFFRKKKNIFKICNVMAPNNLHHPNLGLTLDEPKDYQLIKKIFYNFRKKEEDFTCLEIIDFLKQNKSIRNLNIKVKRKKLPIKI